MIIEETARASSHLEEFMERVAARNAGEEEFLQAVHEVVTSLQPVLERHAKYRRAKVLERDEGREEPWRVQGAGRLDRKGLNFLRALWHWRDDEARSWDRPSFMVATNRQLVDWALRLAGGKGVEAPGHYRGERRKRLGDAIAQAKALPAEEHPERVRGLRRRRDADFDRRVAEIIARRDRIARELDLEGSLLASRAMIESLAAGEEGAEEQFLGWQKALLEL